MPSSQAIPSPQGVSVFGSAIVYVEPDTAVIEFGAGALELEPSDALEGARAVSAQIRAFLDSMDLEEVGTSQIALSEKQRFSEREYHFVGYLARLSFCVRIRDLTRVEELLVGIIAAGADSIQGVDYETTRLQEIRAEARRGAFAAARDKATLYCEAAGLRLGRVLHIEDQNPHALSGSGEGQVTREPPDDEGSGPGALDPSAVSVGGAVNVVFELLAP